MDPLTHGIAGAIVSQSLARRDEFKYASLTGALSAMSADLDIFIHSSQDPLMVVDFHRHFTHSLFFVPIGGIICAFILWLLLRKKIPFKRLAIYSLVAYPTAGLLDTCNSYGVSLLWPLYDARISWNIISVIDPLFTLPLAVIAIAAIRKRSVNIARIGILFAILYLLTGMYQKDRVENYITDLADSRGHHAERLFVHPTLGNLILWRSIYEHEGIYYVDAVRAGVFSGMKLYNGESIDKFDAQTDIEKINGREGLYEDIMRFDHFTLGYMVISPDHANVISDLRYSPVPNSTKPLWGIRIAPEEPDRIKDFKRFREYDRELRNKYIMMLRGKPVKTRESSE